MFKYITTDLPYIYIRVGKENKNLAEITDDEFVTWAKDRFKIEIKDDENAKGTKWTKKQKIDFLNDMSDRLGYNSVVMIRRDKRN